MNGFLCGICKRPTTHVVFDRRITIGSTQCDSLNMCCGYSWVIIIDPATFNVKVRPIAVELDVHGRPVPIPNFFMFLYRRFRRHAMRYM